MNNKAWDKFLLLAVSVIVIGWSAVFAMKAIAFGERFGMERATKNDEMPETLEERAAGATAFVEKTQSWATPSKGEGSKLKQVPLFVSVPIVEAGGKLIDMSDPEAPQLRPPVTNAWLTSNNLDFLNSSVLSQDPDGDGFTNLAEWEAKTNPVDPKAHPPYAEKLIFASRQQEVYMLRFSARPDAERFQIMRIPTAKWPQRDSFMMKVGETSKDQQFRIESFEEKRAVNSVGIEADATEVTVTYLPKQGAVVLVKGVDTPVPTYFAEMKFELDPQFKQYVKEGEAFNLAADPDTKYRVSKVNEDSVVITYQTGTEPEQTIEITKN
jgi:hypothetical protein